MNHIRSAQVLSSMVLFTGLWSVVRLDAQAASHETAPSLNVNSHVLRLGAPLDAELIELRNDYAVAARKEGGAVQGYDVSSRGGDRYAFPLVSLWSSSGRIVGIEQVTEIDTKDGLFDALFYIASKVGSENRQTCGIAQWTGSTGDLKIPISKASVVLTCGPYTFTILRNTFKSSTDGLVVGYLVSQRAGISQ